MRINFKRIEIHNFMAYADEVFDFDKHIGLNLICGKNNDVPGSKNGCAKSQLFGALCYSLYGETPNKVKNENIKNRYVKQKDMTVTATFEIEDKTYKTTAGFNKDGRPYYSAVQIDKEGNTVDLTKSTMAETREFIAKEVLHCDMSIFLRTVLLSSDQTYNFFRLRKWEKKDFIEKLFDISVFGEMYTAIHRDVLDNDKEILGLQNKLLVIQKYLDEYKAKIAEHDLNKQKTVEKHMAEVAELSKKLDDIKKNQISANVEEVSKYEEYANKLDAAIVKLNHEVSIADTKIQKADVSIHKHTAARELSEKQISKHDEILSKLCDHCLPLIRDYYNISKLEANVSEHTASIADALKEKKLTTADREVLILKLKKLEDKKQQVLAKLNDLTSEFNKVNSARMLLEQRLENAEHELEKSKVAKNPYADMLDKTQIELDDQTKKLQGIFDKYKYLKCAETIVSQDTLRKFIIKDLIHLLNNKIKIYLSKLGANYTCIFDEDMNYTFITDGGSCEYDSFSSGERMRLNIAASFAFRDFMATRSNLMSNILVLDEYIDSNIDQLAIEGIVGILRDFILLYDQNIYVISHRKEIDNSIFNNIIQVVKTNNISKITYLTAK